MSLHYLNYRFASTSTVSSSPLFNSVAKNKNNSLVEKNTVRSHAPLAPWPPKVTPMHISATNFPTIHHKNKFSQRFPNTVRPVSVTAKFDSFLCTSKFLVQVHKEFFRLRNGVQYCTRITIRRPWTASDKTTTLSTFNGILWLRSLRYRYHKGIPLPKRGIKYTRYTKLHFS